MEQKSRAIRRDKRQLVKSRSLARVPYPLLQEHHETMLTQFQQYVVMPFHPDSSVRCSA